ncbi:MAG: HYR domain-containing protein [Saprospiraceae bacterium]|nr:HYR domain-containing protein [Saprospiraceae bacterium]
MICPNNILITTIAETATVSWELPKVNNACSSAFELIQIDGQQVNTLFSEGTTTIAYLVEDACGRTATCSFTVEVVRQEMNFEVKCPENIDVTLPPGQWITRIYWEEPFVITDCHYGLTVKRVKGAHSGSYFTVGFSEIIYQIKDECGNSATCSFVISVKPNRVSNRNNDNTATTLSNWRVYPNPVSDQLNIHLERQWMAQPQFLEITDGLGTLKIRQVLSDASHVIEVSGLSNGWYFWRILDENNQVLQTGKLAKQADIP